MISLQIVTDKSANANEIGEFLLKEKLILEAIIQEPVSSKVIENKNIITLNKVLLTGITKALLFDKIDKELKANFPDINYSMHSMPIVYMEWERQNKLLQEVENI